MGNSLLPAAPLAGGQILHTRSGSTIDVAVRNGRMFHNLSERGLTAEYPVAYQIGSGKAGHGYIVQAGDYLIQSPAAWYNPHGWDVAPGFVPAGLLDFDRVISETCLFCHAGEAQFSEDGRRFAVMQYLEGKTLDARNRTTELRLDEVLKIAIQIANALAEAHDHGLAISGK